jgi:glycyl-tRNA synthetase beta chain
MTQSVAAPLLIELLTEELPPRALRRLGEAFAHSITESLIERGLAQPGVDVQMFASPRRLAVRVKDVIAQAGDRVIELKGPSVKVGLDAQGQPTQALQKWAQKQGVDPALLQRAHDGRQEIFVARREVTGDHLENVITPVIESALHSLPIPKVMNYQLADGRTTVSFVRPAHGLIVLHASTVVPAQALGLQSGRSTLGHRFQCQVPVEITDASAYEALLADHGRVIAGFDVRRQRIEDALTQRAASLGAFLGEAAAVQALLEEVTALVEWPAVYVGEFEPEFLQVPQECLILTMRTNQKYFPLFDRDGKLLPKFLIVSNMALEEPRNIIDGNQRVVRPRLADARFFFEQDKKATLASRIEKLGSVVYHGRLGTQAQRMERVRAIALGLATQLAVDATLCERAAMLAKTDLLTGMVGEFPELQGIMGRYYARHDGEPAAVAQALAEQYLPRFAGDALPSTEVGTVLALADKLETLAGLFGIGQLPSGDKDPFALRRHALGVIRMLIEKKLVLGLDRALQIAFEQFPQAASNACDELKVFFLDRLSGFLRDKGYAATEVAALIEQAPMNLASVPARMQAVRAFATLPQAPALAAANKRIGNILRKQAASLQLAEQIDAAVLVEPAEKTLAALVTQLQPQVDARMAAEDFTGALTLMAQARDPVDAFFNEVMVMADDPKVRDNRLALLAQLHRLMNQVADLSKLSAS